MRQLGVGRERLRPRLHGRVDNDLCEVRRLRCTGAWRPPGSPGSAPPRASPDPLARVSQRRAVEGQLLPEDLLAAKQLARGSRPRARQIFVRQVVHVLEDRKPRHQPRRQRQMAGPVGVDRAEPLFEKAPVDRSAELGDRVTQARRCGRAGARSSVRRNRRQNYEEFRINPETGEASRARCPGQRTRHNHPTGAAGQPDGHAQWDPLGRVRGIP